MLPARALRTIRKHDLFPPGARVLVALSGGADSVALLHILRVLERRGALRVAGIGHLNHGLRGAESDGDERFCRDLAAREALPVEVGYADIAQLARSSGRSIEDAARAARYAFLLSAADRLGAEVVAVGHSLDDQAETVLLRLIRGAGPRGLAGIRPKAGRIVRPLLDITRDELRRYAAAHALVFRDDASNADVTIPRNRIRLDLMPHLEQYSPAIASVLARQAEVAREDEAYLSGQANEAYAVVVSHTAAGLDLDAAGLSGLPRAIAARVARLALEHAASGRFVAAAHIDCVLSLAAAADGASAALPGCIATRRGGRIVFGSPDGPPFSNALRQPLPVPGEVALPGWLVSAEELDASPEGGIPPARGATVVLAAQLLRGPLAVRTRRRGDRFRPLGMGGRRRKLQDFLVDRKIARAERDSLPLVVDRDDRIVWVVGQTVAEDFRVTEPSRAVILLKARRLGGLG
jgi:tRNA(Ile)-lysidine synthase